MPNKLSKINNCEAQTIAKNIYSLMRASNVTETELARALDVSVMTIRRVISGETEDPRISTLKLIANYFNVGVDSLLTQNDTPIKLFKKQKPLFVPIVDWKLLESCNLEKIDFSTWSTWYPIINNDSLDLNEHTFAIETKSSMQPKYPKGTLLIVKPDEIPVDNDIVLIRSLIHTDVSLRELVIDYPKWLLHPIIVGSELIFYNKDEYDIIGVVMLTIFQSRM